MYDFAGMGRHLQDRRRELGYTQEFVEEKTGICIKTLQNIEYANTETGIEYICRLFTLYGIPLEWIGNFFVLDEQDENECILFEFLRERERKEKKEPVGIGQ